MDFMWVIEGSQGERGDRESWLVGIVSTESRAREIALNLNNLWYEIVLKFHDSKKAREIRGDYWGEGLSKSDEAKSLFMIDAKDNGKIWISSDSEIRQYTITSVPVLDLPDKTAFGEKEL